MAGRRRREKPVVTFAIYKPEYGEMRTYAGEAAREIIRGIVQSEAEKLVMGLLKHEDLCQ